MNVNHSSKTNPDCLSSVATLQSVERGVYSGPYYYSRATLLVRGRRYALPVSPSLIGDPARFRRYVREKLKAEIRTGNALVWWPLVLGVVR